MSSARGAETAPPLGLQKETFEKVLFPSFRSRIWSGINSGGESRKSLKPLDPPAKPGDDGVGAVSPGPAFAMAMDGQASRGMTILQL
jgi:hypothetical protein